MSGHSVESDAPQIERAAHLSACGRYRYVLSRWWGWGPRLVFVMLNPSTADAEVDDPTIRRCIGFARRDGFSGVTVVNLYAWRATKPAAMWAAEQDGHDITGGERNDDLLREVLRQAKAQPVIAAWGANARSERVAEFTSWRGIEHVKALGVTKDGAPRHPLYLRADARPEPWPTCVTSPDVREHEDCGDVDCETCHPTAPLIVGELDPSIPIRVTSPADGHTPGGAA